MFLNKKLIAVFATLSMLATSLFALPASAADVASLKAEVVAGENTVLESDIGVKFSFDNVTTPITGFTFIIKIPSGLKNDSGKNLTAANIKKSIAYDEANEENPFADGWDVYVKGNDNYQLMWTTATGAEVVTNGDWFELDLSGATTYDELAEGSFKITNTQYSEKGVVGEKVFDVTDPTTKEPSVEPTTPEYVYNADKPADTKWGAATFVGDYSTADDKAIAVKAEVKPGQKVVDGALVDNTYTGLVWKAVKADGTAVGYEQDGLSITGNGTYVFGLAIDGVSEAEVQTNGFGIAVK